VRFTQPNRAHLEMPVVHSLEHLFAEHSRNHSSQVVDFSPMGCQTGFYLILQGTWELGAVLDLVQATLEDVLVAAGGPRRQRDPVRLGRQHTLQGAQDAARTFLAARSDWSQVTA